MNQEDDLIYLMNPSLYDRYKELSSNERDTQFTEEKKFYRKRIQQMAKDCSRFGIIKGAEQNPPPKQLLSAFNEFCRACIDHFKLEDESEFYQGQYKELQPSNEEPNTTTSPTLTSTNSTSSKNMDVDVELLSRKQPKKVVTMSDFVTRKSNQPAMIAPIPKQQNPNVKEEKYRTKGVKKNKKNKSNE
jgi:hypothetical protein